MRRIRIGIGLLAACCFLTGCGAVEVRDRAYVQSVTLSAQEAASEVSLHLFETPSESETAYGDTLSQALEEAQVQLGKSLFMGHLELISLEEVTFCGQLLLLQQTHQLSPSCKVLFHLQQAEELSSSDTEQLVQMLRQAEEAGQLPETDLLSILTEQAGISGCALMPVFTQRGFGMGVCLQNQDFAELTDDSGKGLCWLRGDNPPKRMSVTTQQGTSDCELTLKQSELRASASEGTVQAVFRITLQAPGTSKEERAVIQETVQRQCRSAWGETVYRLHADVIRLDAQLLRDCYQLVREMDWDTLCETAEFSCQVTVQG